MLKRYLSAALALVMSMSCFSYVFNADVSTGERSVDLQSFQPNGSYSNKNNEASGIYAVDLMKSSTVTNKLKVVYNVDPMLTVDDVPASIELFIPKATISEDQQLEVSSVEAVGSDIQVSANGNGSKVQIPVVRDKLIQLDSLELIVPFKLQLLADLDDIVVTLVSKDNQRVNYSWGVSLVDVSQLPEMTLPERLDANTRFQADELKALPGMKYLLPISVQSVTDEESVSIKVTNPNFSFKQEDGTWVEGYGIYNMRNMTAGKSIVVPVEVFALRDGASKFTMSVDNEDLTSTTAVTSDTVMLNEDGTDVSLPVNQTGKIKLTFAYGEPNTGNNLLKFDISGYDSSQYIIDTANANVSVDTENKQVVFEADYTPKKAYSGRPLTVKVNTEFNGKIYTLAEKQILLTAVESGTVRNDIAVTAEKQDNNIIGLSLKNNGSARATVSVDISVDTDKIHLTTDNQVTKVSSSSYRCTMDVEPNATVVKNIHYVVGPDCNPTTADKEHIITFTAPVDDNTSNNTATVKLVVPGKPVNSDFAIVGFDGATSIANGQTRGHDLLLRNLTGNTGTVDVQLTVSNTDVTLSSSVHDWKDLGNGTYSFSKEISGNTSIKIPIFMTTSFNANATDDDLPFTIVAEIKTKDGDMSNNRKVSALLIVPDDLSGKPLPIDLNEYFELSFSSNKVERMQPAIITLHAKQLKQLPTTLNNGKVTLEVVGDVKDHTGRFIVEKKIATFDISSITNTITFVPTNVGEYKVLANVTCDNLTQGGDLNKIHVFNIDADSGKYPETPLVSSSAIKLESSMTDVEDNKAVLSVKVKNTTDYIFRGSYLNLSYATTINLKHNGNLIKGDFFIGNVAPNSEKVFEFPVEVLRSGGTNIVVTFKSRDLNTSVFEPKTTCYRDVTFVDTPVEEKTYSISGIVFNDKNSNSVMNADEEGIANVTVKLKEPVGNVLKQVRTLTSGYYEFAGLKPGSYVVTAEYMSRVVNKNITISDASQQSFNVPMRVNVEQPSEPEGPNNPNLPDNPNGDQGGIVSPGTPAANVSLHTNVTDIRDKYYVIDVTVRNNSQVSTFVNIAATETNCEMQSNSEWKYANGVRMTDYFALMPFDSKTFTVRIDRDDVNGSVRFTASALSDITVEDNADTVRINSLKAKDIDDDDDEDDKKHDTVVDFDTDIVDFSPVVWNQNVSDSGTPNTPNTPSAPNGQQVSQNTQNAPSVSGNGQGSVSIPKTGEGSNIDSFMENLPMLMAYVGGIASLCYAICTLLTTRKNNK